MQLYAPNVLEGLDVGARKIDCRDKAGTVFLVFEGIPAVTNSHIYSLYSMVGLIRAHDAESPMQNLRSIGSRA